MILPKMTYEEMRREIERDSENFHRWLPHQRRRILEVARRCKSFPSHMMMRYNSPRKNNWLIHVLLTSTNMSGAFITYCIVRRDEEGVFVHLVMENAPGMVCQDILTPHCLKRYAERTGRVGLSAEQLAEAWMTNNYDTICDNTQSLSGVRSQTGTQWHSCTNEGIMMGDFIKSANTFIARTFITYDMAKERQVEVFGYCKGKLFDSYNLKRDIQNYLKRKENYNIQRL